MCELLGISSSKETKLRYSMQAMKAHSKEHKDGWGVAYYPKGSKQCAVFKEDCSLIQSDTAKFLNSSNKICSKIILNHIRKSTTSKTYDNTHPFTRELFGQQWVMMHNGAQGLDNYFKNYLISHDNKIDFHPFGTTGSDKAFCIILNELKNNLSTEVSCISNGNSVSVVCTYSFKEAQKIIYEECIKIMNSGADFNMILSNGEYLMAFHSGYNHLHYVIRDNKSSEYSNIQLMDQDFESIDLYKEPDEKAVIVATEVLTLGENWIPFSKGEFLVFKAGECVFKNGAALQSDEISHQIATRVNNVEVYDSPEWLDKRRANYKVIGMPLALRQSLKVELGDKVIVDNGDKRMLLEVSRTDKRLIEGGKCEAVNPDCHVCIPRAIRNELELMEIPSNRSSMEGFRKKFSCVGLEKYKS